MRLLTERNCALPDDAKRGLSHPPASSAPAPSAPASASAETTADAPAVSPSRGESFMTTGGLLTVSLADACLPDTTVQPAETALILNITIHLQDVPHRQLLCNNRRSPGLHAHSKPALYLRSCLDLFVTARESMALRSFDMISACEQQEGP